MGGKLLSAVNDALESMELQDEDQATAELARAYARNIDARQPIEKVGPALLACLDALLMTPRARAAVMKGAPGAGAAKPSNPIDELRERRRARKNNAEAVDPAAT